MNNTKSPIIIALDFSEQQQVFNLVDQLSPDQCRLKVGKELFTSYGPKIVEQLQNKGFEVFLDLKFHDIPNTTAKAVQAAANLGVWMTNVHCSGGLAMLEHCVNSLEKSRHKPILIGVTLLTSMSQQDLTSLKINKTPEQVVLELAALAQQAGLDGLVCSAQEAKQLKQLYPQFCLVTPGIRMQQHAADDQQRTMTPKQALDSGSDYLVVGRPITKAEDPAKALANIIASIKA